MLLVSAFVAAMAMASIDCRAKQVVARGEECTSRSFWDENNPQRVCEPSDSCLLMPARGEGKTALPRTLTCVRRCSTDADCATVGAGARCTHADSHGDEHGCVVP